MSKTVAQIKASMARNQKELDLLQDELTALTRTYRAGDVFIIDNDYRMLTQCTGDGYVLVGLSIGSNRYRDPAHVSRGVNRGALPASFIDEVCNSARDVWKYAGNITDYITYPEGEES